MKATVTRGKDLEEALAIASHVLGSIIPSVRQSAAQIQRIANDAQILVCWAEHIGSPADVNATLTDWSVQNVGEMAPDIQKLANIISDASASSEEFAVFASRVNDLARALNDIASKFKL